MSRGDAGERMSESDEKKKENEKKTNNNFPYFRGKNDDISHAIKPPLLYPAIHTAAGV